LSAIVATAANCFCALSNIHARHESSAGTGSNGGLFGTPADARDLDLGC